MKSRKKEYNKHEDLVTFSYAPHFPPRVSYCVPLAELDQPAKFPLCPAKALANKTKTPPKNKPTETHNTLEQVIACFVLLHI